MSVDARWVFTNTWAVVIALMLHAVVSQLIELEAASILTGSLIIGGVLGWAQSRALARRVATLNRRHWITLTIVGAALVLLVGEVSTRLGLAVQFATFEGEEALASVQRAWSAVFLTQLTGLLIGLLLGATQSRALPAPGYLRLAWVLANGAGWSLGMVLTSLPLGLVDADANLRWIFAALFAGLALTGCAVGFFTGLVLQRLATHPGA